MKFSELFTLIQEAVDNIRSNEFDSIEDIEITIRADDKYHTIVGAYVEMEEEGDLYIVFDTNRKLLLGEGNPVICHYISNYAQFKEFKEWLEKSPSMDPKCLEIRETLMFSVCGIDAITKYRYNQKPRVEIYIKSEIIDDKPFISSTIGETKDDQ